MLAFDFDQISSAQWGMVAIIATCTLIYVASRRQRNPERRVRQSRSESSESDASIRSLQADLGTLITELESLSARLSNEAEAREAKLRELIALADERVTALQAQVNSPPPARTLSHNTIGPPSVAPTPTLRSLVAPASVPASTPTVTDDRHRAIYSLADEGLTAVEIAQRTGQRVGEIELILNLRPKLPSLRGR